MAKDYFQDITPPAGGTGAPRQFPPRPETPPSAQTLPTETPSSPEASGGRGAPSFDEEQEIPIRREPYEAGGASASPADPALRGIRNISAPPRPRPRIDSDMRQPAPPMSNLPPRPPRHFSRVWIWALAALSLLVLAALLLFAFRPTSVTITPKSQAVLLTGTSPFIARAAEAGVGGELTYALQTSDLEDSEVVSAEGTTHVETKASGSLTVYNSYSASPVRLVKNTRFESPDGLIFRVPADIVVPGKSGTTPGQTSVTVIADQPGEKYNIAPVSRFTLPGLKATAAMYAGVYAKSSAAMSGGFSGEQPGTAPGALEAAQAQVRSRLEGKAHQAALGQASESSTIFPELIRMTYQSLPNTTEAGGGVRIHEKAHVEVPVFPAEALAQAIAESAGANVDGALFIFKPGSDFAVQGASSSTGAGETISFSLSGSGLIVWKVDTEALTSALAGRGSEAFQGIVNGFSGIEEARARIEPFWKKTFPAKAGDIKVKVETP